MELQPSVNWWGICDPVSGDVDSAQLSVSALALRSTGWAQDGSASITMSGQPFSELFVLANSSMNGNVWGPPNDGLHTCTKVSLFYTNNPGLPTPWSQMDLKFDSADHLPGLTPTSSIGPNAIAVKRTFTSGGEVQGGLLFAAYSTSDPGSYRLDNQGLMVAVRPFGIDQNGTITWNNWQGGTFPYLVGGADGDNYAIPGSNSPMILRTDQIDLAIRPEAVNLGMSPQWWNGMGLVYIDYVANRLRFAETEPNTMGPPVWHSSNLLPEGALDHGEIYWVKLAYVPTGLYSSEPCVLYALQDDRDHYSIRYWRPEGGQ